MEIIVNNQMQLFSALHHRKTYISIIKIMQTEWKQLESVIRSIHLIKKHLNRKDLLIYKQLLQRRKEATLKPSEVAVFRKNLIYYYLTYNIQSSAEQQENGLYKLGNDQYIKSYIENFKPQLQIIDQIPKDKVGFQKLNKKIERHSNQHSKNLFNKAFYVQGNTIIPKIHRGTTLIHRPVLYHVEEKIDKKMQPLRKKIDYKKSLTTKITVKKKQVSDSPGFIKFGSDFQDLPDYQNIENRSSNSFQMLNYEQNNQDLSISKNTQVQYKSYSEQMLHKVNFIQESSESLPISEQLNHRIVDNRLLIKAAGRKKKKIQTRKSISSESNNEKSKITQLFEFAKNQKNNDMKQLKIKKRVSIFAKNTEYKFDNEKLILDDISIKFSETKQKTNIIHSHNQSKLISSLLVVVQQTTRIMSQRFGIGKDEVSQKKMQVVVKNVLDKIHKDVINNSREIKKEEIAKWQEELGWQLIKIFFYDSENDIKQYSLPEKMNLQPDI